MNIFLLTSRDKFKDRINMSSESYDNIVDQMIESATREIEHYTSRKLRGRTYGANGLDADYYNGNGQSRLMTNQYPIISVTSLYDDLDRDFGSDTLKTSSDYYIFKDEGIIQLNLDAVLGTVFEKGNANVKLIYTAGYDEFQIIDGTNDRIDFVEEDGGSELTADLTGGIYTASSLASHIATQLDAAGANTYTVTYNYITSKFTISTDGAFLSFNWNSGANAYRSACLLLGYRDGADDTGATSYTSDDSILGIPSDLEQACLEIVERTWNNSKYGKSRFDKKSKRVEGEMAGTTAYNTDPLPPHVKNILDRYKRHQLAY